MWNSKTYCIKTSGDGSDSSDAGTIVPAGVQIGLGVKTAAVYRIAEQGNLTLTENTLDLAINGEGYFEVELPDGETAYTRSRRFPTKREWRKLSLSMASRSYLD